MLNLLGREVSASSHCSEESISIWGNDLGLGIERVHWLNLLKKWSRSMGSRLSGKDVCIVGTALCSMRVERLLRCRINQGILEGCATAIHMFEVRLSKRMN